MYCGGQIGIDDGVQRTQHEENINIKTEKVVNNIAEVENAKNQGFLYRSRYILIIAGVAVTVLAIFVGIAFGFITAWGNRGAGSYKPSHTASKDEVEIDKHTKAEFTKVIFGKFEEESNLIVSEQEVKTEWELEKEGLFGWSVLE